MSEELFHKALTTFNAVDEQLLIDNRYIVRNTLYSSREHIVYDILKPFAMDDKLININWHIAINCDSVVIYDKDFKVVHSHG